MTQLTAKRRPRTPAPPPHLAETLEPRRLLSAATTAVLLKDINTSGAGALFGQSAQLGDGQVLFELKGRELWKTDGTEAGTTLVKSLNLSGSSTATSQYWTPVGDQIFFRAFDPQNGWELWKTDGTPDGTGLVKNIRPDTAASPFQSSSPFALINFKDTLYFFADDGVHGYELWKSDGTESGTTLFKDLRPGPGWSAIEPSPTHGMPAPLYAVVGNTLYFTTFNDAPGALVQELWKTDGTPEGTIRVHRLPIDEAIRNLANIGGRPVMSVQEYGSTTTELRTDDDGDGTWSASRAPITGPMIETGPIAFFRGRNTAPATERGLWRTDGTAAGTFQVKDFPDVNAIGNFVPLADGLVAFTAADAQGHALWRSDGTPAGTFLLRRLLLPPTPTPAIIPHPIIAMRHGDHAYFSLTVNAAEGNELWRTDGTIDGTTLVADLKPGSPSSAPRLLGRAGGDLVFYADDGPHGHELWKTDGTFSGTGLVADLNPANDPSDPGGFTRVGDVVFFTARTDEHGSELWKTDGTADGTVLVKDVIPGPTGGAPWSLTEMGGRLYFISTDGTANGHALWTSDGTPEGTVMVNDPNPVGQAFIINGSYLSATDTHLFFLASDGVHGYEIWSSDGTPDGTAMLRDFAPGDAETKFPALLPMGDTMYFRADGDLWRSDGTAAGTTLVKELGSPWPAATFDRLTRFDDDTFYFVGADRRQLWRSDGTADGTALVTQLPATSGSKVSGLTPYEGSLYFFHTEDAGLYENVTLYRTDGAPETTEKVGQIQSDAAGEPYYTKVVGETMYFIASAHTGVEYLWRTDGTLAGTRVIDLDPGPAIVPSNVSTLHDFNGALAFYTWTFATSRATLWLSDGTEAGTRPLQVRGASGTAPNSLDAAELDGRFIFAGYDEMTGYEPYLLVNPVHRTITGTDADEHWTIRNVATDRIGVWRSGTGRDQPPDFEYLKAEVASLTFVGGAGDDTVFISGDASFPLIFDGGDGSDRVGSLCKNDDLTGNFETIDVHDGYDLSIHGQFDFDSITLTAQGRLILTAGSNTTVRTRALNMDAPMGDLIDVNDNTLIVEDGDLAAVESMVALGRNGGPTRWDGRGIKSTFAANGSALEGLNVVQVGNDVIVKYGYNGDANLDGRVNADDYFRIDQAFLAQPANPTYFQGDFNFDDRVNADDYFLIDQAFLGQSALLAAAAATTPAEPGARRVYRCPRIPGTTRPPSRSRPELRSTGPTRSVTGAVRARDAAVP